MGPIDQICTHLEYFGMCGTLCTWSINPRWEGVAKSQNTARSNQYQNFSPTPPIESINNSIFKNLWHPKIFRTCILLIWSKFWASSVRSSITVMTVVVWRWTGKSRLWWQINCVWRKFAVACYQFMQQSTVQPCCTVQLNGLQCTLQWLLVCTVYSVHHNGTSAPNSCTAGQRIEVHLWAEEREVHPSRVYFSMWCMVDHHCWWIGL